MKTYKWCAIDAEGDAGKAGLIGVAFFSAEHQCYLTDHAEIRELLYYHACEKYTFVAHNAQYDLPVIFWQLRIPMKAVYFNHRFNRGEWKYHRGEPMAQLWDSYTLSGKIRLEDLGPIFGLPKYKTPQRLQGLDPNRFQWRCDLHQVWECEPCYATRDAEIVYRFMVDLSAMCAMWGLSPTRRLSSLSMRVWRALDKPEPISLLDARPDSTGKPTRKTTCNLSSVHSWKVRELARQAYHGGRVETFKLGSIKPCYTADVTAMYPSVMASTPYPDPSHMFYVTNPRLGHVPWDREGVAELEISIPVMSVPPLPYVRRAERLYPVGLLRGTWTLREVRYAIALGCTVRHVYQLAYSSQNLYPFNQFVEQLWAIREAFTASGDPRAVLAKLIMNNLYGRIGMSDTFIRTDYSEAGRSFDPHRRDYTSWKIIDKRVFLEYEREQRISGPWTNLLWAAQTTSAARIRLHGHLLAQGSNLLYCDTDSVFSRAPIVGCGTGLGALCDEQFYQAAYIAAPKLYCLVDEHADITTRAKGIPQQFALQFMQHGMATYQTAITPRESLRSGRMAGTWVDVSKSNRGLPHRRQPTDPTFHEREYGWSDTEAPVVGPLSARP